MDYTKKYLKYKTKYLNLKKLIGGEPICTVGLFGKNKNQQDALNAGCKNYDFESIQAKLEDQEKLAKKMHKEIPNMTVAKLLNAGYTLFTIYNIILKYNSKYNIINCKNPNQLLRKVKLREKIDFIYQNEKCIAFNQILNDFISGIVEFNTNNISAITSITLNELVKIDNYDVILDHYPGRVMNIFGNKYFNIIAFDYSNISNDLINYIFALVHFNMTNNENTMFQSKEDFNDLSRQKYLEFTKFIIKNLIKKGNTPDHIAFLFIFSIKKFFKKLDKMFYIYTDFTNKETLNYLLDIYGTIFEDELPKGEGKDIALMKKISDLKDQILKLLAEEEKSKTFMEMFRIDKEFLTNVSKNFKINDK